MQPHHFLFITEGAGEVKAEGGEQRGWSAGAVFPKDSCLLVSGQVKDIAVILCK